MVLTFSPWRKRKFEPTRYHWISIALKRPGLEPPELQSFVPGVGVFKLKADSLSLKAGIISLKLGWEPQGRNGSLEEDGGEEWEIFPMCESIGHQPLRHLHNQEITLRIFYNLWINEVSDSKTHCWTNKELWILFLGKLSLGTLGV